MMNPKGKMDESILVCVSCGQNGERLMRRGHRLATLLNCPLYILTVDARPADEFDAVKSDYIEEWRQLAKELGAEAFIVRDNEERSSVEAIAEVVNTHNITQVIIGQSPQNRWEEITKGSFTNALLRKLAFTDIHIVSIDRTIENPEDAYYEKGIRCYLIRDDESGALRLCFQHPREFLHEGIFYKEIGTDFNNGIFKFLHKGRTYELHVTEDEITEPNELPE